MSMEIEKALEKVNNTISQAARRAGRSKEDITLVAVTKTFPPSLIKEAVKAGITLVGENRVQEAGEKIQYLHDQGIDNVQWHMIGHLQRNKARQAVQYFDLIHSVDNLELLRIVNHHSEKAEKAQDVLIQIKLSDEEQKSGLMPEKLSQLLEAGRVLQSVTIKGLMTMLPYSPNPEDSRPYYRRLREIAHEFTNKGHSLNELSMGMSHDYDVAIEEGATMIRVGTALFGKRECAVR